MSIARIRISLDSYHASIIKLDVTHARAGTYGCAVITVSTSRYGKTRNVKQPEDAGDISGGLIIRLLEAAGHRICGYELVSDDAGMIRDAVAALSMDADAIMITGGTGISPRDVTIEAVAPLFEKEIPGFGELFRQKSLASIGTAAMLSRATAGVAGGKVIFCLPGSPAGVELALTELIIPELGHLMNHIRETK
ncbi:MAG TPA: MogA/MoaB family molybdenum cofactor biosynthesis protein [Candidatus Methanoperedenaceae archaeon]|nr:MogA/MoaB family molybdenum cofactor biosynthesis protein [Candidatus Methanoperedenaceae archaeon]